MSDNGCLVWVIGLILFAVVACKAIDRIADACAPKEPIAEQRP